MTKGISKQDQMANRVAHAFAAEVIAVEESEPTDGMIAKLNGQLKILTKEVMEDTFFKSLLSEDEVFKWLSEDLKNYLSMRGKWDPESATDSLFKILTSKNEIKSMLSKVLSERLPSLVQDLDLIIDRWFEKNKDKVLEALS
jgi:hypothetical protein